MSPSPAPQELFPSKGDPSTGSSSHTLYTDRKEGVKEETELNLLIGKRQSLSPIIQPQMEPPSQSPGAAAFPKHLKRKILIQEDIQEIKTPGEGLFQSDPFTPGGLIPTCGVGRLGIPSHLREKLCNTVLQISFASLFAMHLFQATWARML